MTHHSVLHSRNFPISSVFHNTIRTCVQSDSLYLTFLGNVFLPNSAARPIVTQSNTEVTDSKTVLYKQHLKRQNAFPK